MSSRLHTVRVRITAIATAMVAIAIALAAWGLVRAVEHQLLDKLQGDRQARIHAILGELNRGVPPDRVAMAPALGIVQLVDSSGRVVGGTAPLPTPLVIAGEGTPAGAFGTTEVKTIPPGASAAEAFDVSYSVADTPGGTFTVVAASPLDGVARSIATLKGSLMVGLPLVVALVGLVTWIVVGRALHPVEAMRAEVEAISAGTLHRRVPEPTTDDEVGRLARTMNAMLGRLEHSSVAQRQFVADASHELRSPVAAIRTGLEVALIDPAAADWPAVAGAALVEEGRLEALVADLLLLASIDEQANGSAATTIVDVAAVVAAEAARSRAVPVTVTANTPVTVPGQRDHLVRLVANLLDNACRYARTTVAISVSRRDGTVRIAVDDDGPGIPVEDRERVFERFTRLDSSRARNGAGGAGLGLALGKAIVDRHGGKITVDDAPIGGARLLVVLPG